jgi:hypothetical protein
VAGAAKIDYNEEAMKITRLALLCAALAAHLPDPLAAQAPGTGSLVTGSVSGTLVTVDKKLSAMILRTDEGRQMAWRLDRSVIEQLSRFKTGDRLWTIYRELGGGDRAVTAIGFPGSEKVPVYVNATGSAVRLHTAAYLDGGACRGYREDGQVSHSLVRRGASADNEAPCWCCSSMQQTCEPANRAYEPGDRVTGRIILSRCFP